MMDTRTVLSVHRCRFVDFAPAAVTALAFPPLPLPLPSSLSKGKQKQIDSTTKQISPRFGSLAVGRANGNIELCEWTGAEDHAQAPQAWVVRKTLYGPTSPAKVDALAFALRDNHNNAKRDATEPLAGLRLFSTGGGTDLIEWDLLNNRVLRTEGSQGGSIWSIAVNPASTVLALGCEDGAVRLLSLENDALTHLRRFDRVKSRILSIAWGPPKYPTPQTKPAAQTETGDDEEDEDEAQWQDEWLVTGGSDNSLRKWNVRTGRSMEKMTTDKARGEKTLVWAVGVLGDGTIVSGDSLGLVKFWDSRTCTQLQSFQGHSADVLSLAISPEGTAVYTTGVDQKITQFTYVNPPSSSASSSSLLRPSGKWVQTSSRRLHSHDVRALAMWPPHTCLPPGSYSTMPHEAIYPPNLAPILASGGLDMSVVLTPAALPAATTRGKVTNPLVTSAVATFEDAYQRRIAYPTGNAGSGGVLLARQARLLMALRENGVTLWRIDEKKKRDQEMEIPAVPSEIEEDGWARVLEMELSTATNLVAGAISDEGRWLAVADLEETKLFSLNTDDKMTLRPKRIRDFSSVLSTHLPKGSLGASALAFSPDGSKLVLTTSAHGLVVVVDLRGQPRVLRVFEHHRMRDVVLGKRARAVKRNKKLADDEDDITMQNGIARTEDALDAGSDEEAPEDPMDTTGEGDESPIPAQKGIHTVVSRIAVSADGQWLATSDHRARTHIFNLDAIAHHAVLPSFPLPVHAMAFSPDTSLTSLSSPLLVLCLPNNTLHVYDVEARAFPQWARALAGVLPVRLTGIHDPLVGVTFGPASSSSPSPAAAGTPIEDITTSTASPTKSSSAAQNPHPTPLYLWGSTWLCKVHLTAPAGWGGFTKKRRREAATAAGRRGMASAHHQDGGDENFRVVTQYRPVLLIDFMVSGELVVVERPLPDVLRGLPPAFFKAKYGS